MEAVARLKNCPGSPRKMRLVADNIRGMQVEQALNRLKYIPRRGSKYIEKLLISAVSNWQTKNEGLRPEDAELFVKEIFVDGGRMLKRFRPAPRGMAHRIRKRSNHVTVIVDSRIELGAEVVEEVDEKAEGQDVKQIEGKDTKALEAKASGKKENENENEKKATAKADKKLESKEESKETKKEDNKESASAKATADKKENENVAKTEAKADKKKVETKKEEKDEKKAEEKRVEKDDKSKDKN